MTKVQRLCCAALGVLAVLSSSTVASFAQKTTEPDLFAVLPASDTLILLDFNRISSDVLPRLLVDERDARALVIALPESNTVDLLDPRALQRLVIGFRYADPKDEKSDFAAVTVAQSSDAGQLPALIRSRGSGKYREQQYAGKTLYITKVESKNVMPALEWAIVALDANTLIFGDPNYVRSSVDVSTGNGATASADLVAAVKRNPQAFVSAAGLLPPALTSATSQQLGMGNFSQLLSSLKRFSATIETIPVGMEIAVKLDATSAEQSKSLADVLGALKTLAVSAGSGKTNRDRMARDLLKGLVISTAGAELQIRDEVTQATVNELAKQFGAQMYFSQGLAQAELGNSAAAIVKYDKAIALEPNEATTFINRGKAHASKGELDAALADYDKAISLDPESALAYNNRCFTRDKKGDFDAAIADCDKSIALDPTFAYPYNNRGFAYAAQGKYEKALPDYDKAIALDAENVFAYQNRGDVRLHQENLNGAITDYDKAITLNAKSFEAYNGRALAHYYKGEFDQALADFDKAIGLNPNFAEAYGNRALSLLAVRKDSQAEQDLKKCFELNERLRIVFEPLVEEAKKARPSKHY